MRQNRHCQVPTHFALNAMATTTYHNQFMRDLDKKWTIIFLYGSAILIYSLMEMFKSNDSLQLVNICVSPAGLHAMPTLIAYCAFI